VVRLAKLAKLEEDEEAKKQAEATDKGLFIDDRSKAKIKKEYEIYQAKKEGKKMLVREPYPSADGDWCL